MGSKPEITILEARAQIADRKGWSLEQAQYELTLHLRSGKVPSRSPNGAWTQILPSEWNPIRSADLFNNESGTGVFVTQEVIDEVCPKAKRVIASKNTDLEWCKTQIRARVKAVKEKTQPRPRSQKELFEELLKLRPWLAKRTFTRAWEAVRLPELWRRGGTWKRASRQDETLQSPQ